MFRMLNLNDMKTCANGGGGFTIEFNKVTTFSFQAFWEKKLISILFESKYNLSKNHPPPHHHHPPPHHHHHHPRFSEISEIFEDLVSLTFSASLANLRAINDLTRLKILGLVKYNSYCKISTQ